MEAAAASIRAATSQVAAAEEEEDGASFRLHEGHLEVHRRVLAAREPLAPPNEWACCRRGARRSTPTWVC